MKKNSLQSLVFVDREEHILAHCNGKKVLHLGATASPKTEINIKNGTLLHVLISKIAKQAIGLDFDASMIDLAKKYGINNIVFGNVERVEDYPNSEFEVIVAGEIFEHLNNPGLAAQSLAQIATSNTEVIVTVPNAYSVKSVIRAFIGYELIHPDHVLFHSPSTLVELFKRYGFTPSSKFTYVNGGSGVLFTLSKALFKFFPSLADGIGIVFKK